MPVRVQIIDSSEFVKVTADGLFDKKASLQMLEKVLQLNEPDGNDILVDLRKVELSLSMLDLIDMVNFMLENRRSFLKKIAILGKEYALPEYPGFFETYSTNRGLNVKIFRDFEDAITWLFEKTD
jgi:hypothetical protein